MKKLIIALALTFAAFTVPANAETKETIDTRTLCAAMVDYIVESNETALSGAKGMSYESLVEGGASREALAKAIICLIKQVKINQEFAQTVKLWKACGFN